MGLINIYDDKAIKDIIYDLSIDKYLLEISNVLIKPLDELIANINEAIH